MADYLRLGQYSTWPRCLFADTEPGKAKDCLYFAWAKVQLHIEKPICMVTLRQYDTDPCMDHVSRKARGLPGPAHVKNLTKE